MSARLYFLKSSMISLIDAIYNNLVLKLFILIGSNAKMLLFLIISLPAITDCTQFVVCVAADLGGLLGLFLGGSAISIFEIIDLVVYNLAVQVKYLRLRNTSAKVADSNDGNHNNRIDNNLNSISSSKRETNLVALRNPINMFHYSNSAFNDVTITDC